MYEFIYNKHVNQIFVAETLKKKYNVSHDTALSKWGYRVTRIKGKNNTENSDDSNSESEYFNALLILNFFFAKKICFLLYYYFSFCT